MASEIMMAIGPPGQSPTTTYTFSEGNVTLSPRADTVRSVPDFEGVVRGIDLFVQRVLLSESAPKVPPTEPFMHRAMDDNDAPGSKILFRYRSGGLQYDGDFVYATKMIHSQARPGATVPWADFARFVAFLHAAVDLMSSTS